MSVFKTVAASLLMSLTVVGLVSAENCKNSKQGRVVSTTVKKQKPSLDIVETAVKAGSFSTLATAVTEAGLVETLKGEGPFTVFAPTDAAFKKLPEGTIERLLEKENKDKLTAILTYHVVPGRVLAADVVKLSEAKTVQGSNVKFEVRGDAVFVNGARVVNTDIKCKNGVIHVIDGVILPPEK